MKIAGYKNLRPLFSAINWTWLTDPVCSGRSTRMECRAFLPAPRWSPNEIIGWLVFTYHSIFPQRRWSCCGQSGLRRGALSTALRSAHPQCRDSARNNLFRHDRHAVINGKKLWANLECNENNPQFLVQLINLLRVIRCGAMC